MNHTHFSWLSRLTLSAGILVLAGCSTVNTLERGQPTAVKTMVPDKRVITDAGLNRHVSIVGVNETIVSTGFVKVQIEVLNTSRSPYGFRYHFDWFDDTGMLVQSPTSSWIDQTIAGKETLSIVAVAPTEQARDFRVKFLSRQ